ncbi:5701_t:CDS:10 [Paraglomus occultum]|uniref:5701_t:CDS:1 n=1 Tax=Paraglomus occultum TaxID=144539 RepID=A0A9N8ZY62_9GLOM|nr:5701_t:CDS:10 [Paraglomus occultum]
MNHETTAADTSTLVWNSVFQLLNNPEFGREEPTDDLVLKLPPGLMEPRSHEDVKREIENRYLTPSTTFPTSWLSECQQHWERGSDYLSLITIEPTEARKTLEITRDLITGQVTGYEEVSSADPFAVASMLGEPDDVTPEANTVEAVSRELEDSLLEDELLTVPPDFERGLIFEDEKHGRTLSKGVAASLNITEMLTQEDDVIELLELEEGSAKKPLEAISADTFDEEQKNPSLSQDKLENAIDQLLPSEPLVGGAVKIKKTAKLSKGRDWAHEVNPKDIPNFDELYPEPAMKASRNIFTFDKLYDFQKQAIHYLERGDSVFVAAHTSSGKTVVAEYAIALAMKHMTRTIYTSPIKALSNQKYRDFRKKDKFGDDVGILTGDIQLKPEASCLIVTTEILKSMLYKQADLIRDVEFVIFDEIHYMENKERGVVWEEVIHLLPAHVNLIFLSATVSNEMELAGWIGRTKEKDIYVIKTERRMVPLEHFLYGDGELHKIVDKKKNWLSEGWSSGYSAITNPKTEAKAGAKTGAKTGARTGAKTGAKTKQGRSNPRMATRGGSSQKNTKEFDRMFKLLEDKDLFPAICFSFSRKNCDKYADKLAKRNLFNVSDDVKNKIRKRVDKALKNLNEDRELPQIISMKRLLDKGIGVHHSGYLPIVKELVEMLFAKKLLKVLFATETFAMGVNMPAKTVVFLGLKKNDGENYRVLKSGEYTQMSGRAGRSNEHDEIGVVIIACPPQELMDKSVDVQRVILGKPTKLESQFRLTYLMILNMLRSEALSAEEMMKNSFSADWHQKNVLQNQKLLVEGENSLINIRKLDCMICNRDIQDFYDKSTEILRLAVILRKIPNSKFEVMLLQDKNAEGVAPLPLTYIQNPPSNVAKATIQIIPYTDIMIITESTITVNTGSIARGDEKEKAKVLQDLLQYANEARAVGVIEHDWAKLRDPDFKYAFAERNTLMKRIAQLQCTKCPEFNEHYGIFHKESKAKFDVELIRSKIFNSGFEQQEEYDIRKKILKELEFIDSNDTLTQKGRVATEINSADPLVVTQLIFENKFADFTAEEIVALLSCFIFQEKKKKQDDGPIDRNGEKFKGRHNTTHEKVVYVRRDNDEEDRDVDGNKDDDEGDDEGDDEDDDDELMTFKLRKGKKIIRRIAKFMDKVQEDFGLEPLLATPSMEQHLENLNFKLVNVVYKWAQKNSKFVEIMKISPDVQEGSIVRCITRLRETCREIKNAARIIGRPTLQKKMEDALQCIDKSIVSTMSLYLYDDNAESDSEKE